MVTRIISTATNSSRPTATTPICRSTPRNTWRWNYRWIFTSSNTAVAWAQDVPENIGYLINGRILHPGDAFQPIGDVDLALVPVNGPWVKMLDVEAWLKKFPPGRFVGIHDGIVNDHGLRINRKVLTLLAERYGATYLPLAPGDTLDMDQQF